MSEFLSLTQIGKIYGVSSHTIGKLFKQIGLRTECGQPSTQAFSEGFVRQCPSTQPETYFYIWDKKKTTELLDGMGLSRAKTIDERIQETVFPFTFLPQSFIP